MKFKTTTTFDNQFRRLKPEYQRTFKSLMPAFSKACDDYLADVGTFTWPKSLRVSQMSGTAKIWEFTWSFSGPDGRATFEFERHGDDVYVKWRRIGGHEIYKNP